MVTLTGTWGMALVVGPDLRAIEAAVRRVLPSADCEAVPGGRVPHLVVRIPVAGDEAWEATLLTLRRLTSASKWSVLTITPRLSGDGETEVRQARAQALLPLATRLPTSRCMLDVDELLVYDVLAAANSPARATIVRDVLGPVLREPGDTGRRLLATLDALHWHDGSAKAAARSLGVHVKTVHNRLRRLEQLTGLRLDRPPDRMRIEVAMYLLRSAELG